MELKKCFPSQPRVRHWNQRITCIISCILAVAVSPIFIAGLAHGTDRVKVQDITGHLERKETVLYKLSNLKKGDELYVYAIGTSGNLDPVAILLKPHIDFEKVRELYFSQLEEAIGKGKDPIIASRELLDKLSLVWNDDMDGRYDSVLRFKVPTDGTYTLLLTGAFGKRTFGRYRLLLGLNAPQVLTGNASPTGERFVFMDTVASRTGKGIEEVVETLTSDRDLRLTDFNAGDAIYVYVQAASEGLKPVVTLYDFGDKPLRIANFTGQEATAVLQYKFPRYTKNCRIKISGRLRDNTFTSGAYRALIGVNSPEVLEGKGEVGGRPVLKKPITVKIGIKMQQITDVDQRSENFGVVATLMMKWDDPTLAFRPDTIQERGKVYTREAFTRHMVEEGILWPEFTIFNQQGNRWIQNSVVAVFSDGGALYLERFSVTLQAPDFNFRRFPFDTQQFFIRVDSLFPDWFFTFDNLKGYSEAARQLGEEEWIVTGYNTIIGRTEIALNPVSQFSFRFEAKRHLTYYLFRIFLPLLIIIVVSWIIFFLKDYTKRIDAEAANLLLFIAVNFAISSDLPRLGYMTLLDMLMAAVFIVTALMLILAVLIRRLVSDGKEVLVNRIDRYVVWFYPFAYIVGLLIVILMTS